MALPVACLYGNSEKGGWDLNEIESYLVQDSSCVNKVINGATPLVTALMDKRCPVDVIKVLLRYGADINIAYENGNSPLAVGLLHGASKDVIQLLLDAGCSLSSCHLAGSTLHCAIAGEALQKDVVHLLIERGADMNAIEDFGYTVMCYALQQHISASSIELLYEAGVPLSACSKHVHPLLCATDMPISSRLLTKNLVEFLLNTAPLNNINSNDLTPLQHALKCCEYEADAIQLLLQHFPDVNIVDEDKNNLLHLAFWNPNFSDLATVKLLIKQGVCVDSTNMFGETPLHLVAADHQWFWRVIELLIKNGAKVNAENAEGETPYEFAVKYVYEGKFDILTYKIFLAAGAHVRLVKNGKFLLERVLDKSIHSRYDTLFLKHFKILLQYNLLENPNISIEEIIEDHNDYETLLNYWKECLVELKKMESVTVGESCTLPEFLKSYFTPSNEVANSRPQVKKYDCDQLLRIKVNKVFPLFSGIISDKVDRWFMEAKLPEIQLYTTKCSSHKAGKEEKVLLPYESVRKIVQYLVDDDLLSLIVALTYIDGHASSNSQEKHIGGKKRISEESTECRKMLKVAS